MSTGLEINQNVNSDLMENNNNNTNINNNLDTE